MKIHLGVANGPHPYWEEEEHKGIEFEPLDTFAIAQVLEANYGLFTQFADYEIDHIAFSLAESANNALQEYVNTGHKPENIFGDTTFEIESDFKEFLDSEKMAKFGIKGVPTKAALEGKSLRFKRKKGPRRPSFIDSGVLQSSFKAWVTES
jgi:hypothetical protein